MAPKLCASARALVIADTSIPWVKGSSKRVMITITSRFPFPHSWVRLSIIEIAHLAFDLVAAEQTATG